MTLFNIAGNAGAREAIHVYVGVHNAVVFRDLQYQEPLVDVPPNTLTRAMFAFGGTYCLDTANPTDPIELYDDNTRVRIRPGMTPGIQPSVKPVVGYLTLFVGDAAYGWTSVDVYIYPWDKCPT